MIEIQGLSKRFGAKQVLANVSFTAKNGAVTGFLGPNGAGKSTTMRALLGLIRPDSGTALVDGKLYAHHNAPLSAVGAVLDAKGAHKGRSAYAHLRSLALTNNIPLRRVDEVIALTGLESAAHKKAGSFSLGMSQRLAIAAALLGDPENLVLDEPINGLDPEGVKWIRDLCRTWAAEGRAVLLSSHLMSEVALTADDLVIIGQGQILEHTTVHDFVMKHSQVSLDVVTPQVDKLQYIFANASQVHVQEVPVEKGFPADARAFSIIGADLVQAAKIFAQAQLVTYRFAERHASLEQAYLALTHSHAEYLAPNQRQLVSVAPVNQAVPAMNTTASPTVAAPHMNNGQEGTR